eukprot:4991105-Prymnesium_polylepis.1
MEDKNWTYIGGLYFIFTICTTIGYGTFAPVTTGGRAFTVFIAFFGVGSFSYFVERLSSMFNHAMAFFANKLSITSNRRRVQLNLCVVFTYWFLGSVVFNALANAAEEDWGIPTSIYYAAITFTTIGLGDYSLRWYGPHRQFEVFFLIFFTTIGLVLFVETGIVIMDEHHRLRDAVLPVMKEAEAEVEKVVEAAVRVVRSATPKEAEAVVEKEVEAAVR